MSLLQDRKLLPKRQIFQEQIKPRAEETNRQDRQKSQQPEHRTSFTRMQLKRMHRDLPDFDADRIFGEPQA